MAGDGAKKINLSLNRVVERSKKIYIAISLLFVLLCIGAAFYVAAMIAAFILPDVFVLSSPFDVFQFGSAVLFVAVFAITLWIASMIFKDIASGKSPFTNDNIKRLRRLCWLMVLAALAGAVISPGFFTAVRFPGFNFGYEASDSMQLISIPIDIKLLVAAGVCYGLSCIFEYGSLLQSLSDETF